MSTPVTLPALGESVTEGTVSRWLKQVGDTIVADEPLVEVSTDKVDTEIPSPASGIVLEIRVGEDETVDVGTVLAIIGDASEGGAASEPEAPAPQPAAEPEPQAAPEPAPQPAAQAAPSGPATGTEVLLPALGESVTEGTVSRWLKAVGDRIEADEPLVEVSTDKVDTEIPSPASGTVLEIRVGEDETVDVGTVLAIIGDAAAAPAAPAAQAPAAPAAPVAAPAPVAPPAPAPAAPAAPAPQAAPAPVPPRSAVTEAAAEDESLARIGTGQRTAGAPKAPVSPQVAPRRAAEAEGRSEIYVTPVVRKLAAQNNVDLAAVTGTGVGGRIRKEDVLAAAEAAKAAAEAAKAAAAAAPQVSAPAPKAAPAAPSPVRGTTEKMTRLRSTIARRMVESLQVSAQLTATVEVDVTVISRLRRQVKDEFKRREGVSLSYLPFITKATIEALKQFPKLNATIDTEQQTITYPDSEHVGIAVDTEKGLLVPVIKDAGDLNIAGLAKKIGDLAARTRASKVTPDELTGGTFTITNYGSAGSLFDTPIINQPQVAILGTGALVKRPAVISDPTLGEVIAIRDMMYLSLSYDHRLVDGALAARFLSAIKARLEGGDFAGEVN